MVFDTAVFDTDKYRNKGSPGTGLLSNGVVAKYSFRAVKACSHSIVQPSNLFPVLSILKSGAQRSVDLDMNRERAMILPLRLWMSLKVFGDFRSKMTQYSRDWPLCLGG